jgi:hypothetical protein
MTQTKLQSQTPDTYCIAVNGGSYSFTKPLDLLVDWSMGDPISNLFINRSKNIMLSSGFLQNKNIDSALFQSLDSFFIPMKIGPNPILQMLKVELSQAGIIIDRLFVLDMTGHIVYSLSGPFSGTSFKQNISFNTMQAGYYTLLLYCTIDSKYTLIRCFKLYKI